MEHIRSYLEGRIDLEQLWQPIPGILNSYADAPDDPNERLPYFWGRAASFALTIVRFGYEEDEPDFRVYMERWLDALQRPDEEWREIVSRKGRPLEENVPDWDR